MQNKKPAQKAATTKPTPSKKPASTAKPATKTTKPATTKAAPKKATNPEWPVKRPKEPPVNDETRALRKTRTNYYLARVNRELTVGAYGSADAANRAVGAADSDGWIPYVLS